MEKSLLPTDSRHWPEWKQHRGNPRQLLELIHDSAAPVVEKSNGPATAGVKAAQLYREIRSGDDPLSDSVIEALFKTARADGDSRLASKKRVVMLWPDGQHVMVSTPGEMLRPGLDGKKVWVKSVAALSQDGRIIHRPYRELLAAGWKPLAAIKTDETAKNDVKTYSFQQWHEIREQILAEVEDRLYETESGVAEISEQAAIEIVGGGDADADKRGTIATVPNAPLFSPERLPSVIELAQSDVECLVTAIGKPRWHNLDEAKEHINAAIGKMPFEALQRILDKLSPKDVNSGDREYQTGLTLLHNHVYETAKGGITADRLQRVSTSHSGQQLLNAPKTEFAHFGQIPAHRGQAQAGGVVACGLRDSESQRPELGRAAWQSSIRMLLPKDFRTGRCVVCGLVAQLKWRDLEMGLMGDCCLSAVIQADKNLHTVNARRPNAVGTEIGK